MDYNELEVAILKFLRPKLGSKFTAEGIYEGIKEEKLSNTELSVVDFTIVLNVLIQEGLVEGVVTQSVDYPSVEGIAAEGLKVLRRTFGPN